MAYFMIFGEIHTELTTTIKNYNLIGKLKSSENKVEELVFQTKLMFIKAKNLNSALKAAKSIVREEMKVFIKNAYGDNEDKEMIIKKIITHDVTVDADKYEEVPEEGR